MLAQSAPAIEFVPTDYSDLFQHYYVYVHKLVRRAGIHPQNSEDVTMSILTTFLQKDVLSDFDAQKGAFRTFLTGFVFVYVRHYRTTQDKLKVREMRSTDQIIDQPGRASDEVVTWIDVYGPIHQDDYQDLLDDEYLTDIRKKLSTASSGRKDSQLELTDFFDAVVEQADRLGKISTTELMEKFGVTRTTVHNWLVRLRSEVGRAVGRD